MVQGLVEYIAKSLVDKSDSVRVVCNEGDGSLAITIHILDEDRGRIIGKRGETVRAIRALVSAVVPDSKHVDVEIVTT